MNSNQGSDKSVWGGCSVAGNGLTESPLLQCVKERLES
jgi:hypothetical protein